MPDGNRNLPAERPAEMLKRGLVAMRQQFASALPPQIPMDRFQNAVMTATTRNPDLLMADRHSLYLSCMDAAADGLLPDGREGALVVFNTKVKRGGKEEWINQVKWMPMVYGVIKRMRNSGEVVSLVAHVVHAKDRFSYTLGDEESVVHEPSMDADPGAVVCAYAIVKLKDGSTVREVMPKRDIDRAREFSKGKAGPAWTNWYTEMARKTVIHRISKFVPTSAEDADFIARSAGASDSSGRTIDLPPRPTRESIEHEAIHEVADGDTFDATTGEIVENQAGSDQEVGNGAAVAEALAAIAAAPSVDAIMEFWRALNDDVADDDQVSGAYEAKREELAAREGRPSMSGPPREPTPTATPAPANAETMKPSTRAEPVADLLGNIQAPARDRAIDRIKATKRLQDLSDVWNDIDDTLEKDRAVRDAYQAQRDVLIQKDATAKRTQGAAP